MSGRVLDTDRFTLKPLKQEDARCLAELGADPDVVKTLVCDWSTPAKRRRIAEEWIESSQAFGIWGVFDREGGFGARGRMIGFCATSEPLPKVGRGPEIYYAFSRDTWGRGVATEVIAAVIDHLFHDRDVDAVEALVLAGLNAASHRLLTRLGMEFVGHYPLVEYVGEETGPTIDYERWRVETSTTATARGNLEEAAFKIGQFVGGGAAPEAAMFKALYRAAESSGCVDREGEDAVREIIRDALQRGMAENGWHYYRIGKKQRQP